jgi:hypothetical protein
MNRRQVVQTGLGIGGIALAGCSSEQSVSIGGTDHLDEAGTAIRKAVEEYNRQTDRIENAEFSEGRVEVDTATITVHLDTASEELTAAADQATATERRAKIGALEDYVAYTRPVVNFLDAFATGYNRSYTGFSELESEEYIKATAMLEQADDAFSTANERLRKAETRAESLDHDALADVVDVDTESVSESLADLRGVNAALDDLASGMLHLAKGMEDFQTASANLDQKRWEEAEQALEDSRDHFESANGTFESAKGDAPPDIASTFEDMICRSGALRDGSDHLARAIRAFEVDRGGRARSEIEAAESAMNRCESTPTFE